MRIKTLLLSILLLSACNRVIEKPKDLIPENEMASIIKDFYLYKNLQSLGKFDYYESYKVNHKLLEKHHVNFDRFKRSYKYYLVEGDRYQAILDKIEKEIKEEYNLPDSISPKEIQYMGHDEIH